MPDILSTIGGALGLTKGEGIKKLQIDSWETTDRSKAADPAFTFFAFINPDEFTINYNVFVEDPKASQTPGANAKVGKILGIAPLDIILKFYLDGTGTSGIPCDVPAQINQFYKTVGWNEKKHTIRYLSIIWGSLQLLRPNQFGFECMLKNASIQYKLFNADGTPLRALITATFTEALSDDKVALEYLKQSPDLTHIRIVKEGDTLPGLAYDIYGDLKYYFEVAKVNNLKDFRNILPGQKLIFPPFEKNTNVKK